MRIKIISDGTAHGTQVVNAETGEPIEHVQRVAWRHEAGDVPRAYLVAVDPIIEAAAEIGTGEIDVDPPWRTGQAEPVPGQVVAWLEKLAGMRIADFPRAVAMLAADCGSNSLLDQAIATLRGEGGKKV